MVYRNAILCVFMTVVLYTMISADFRQHDMEDVTKALQSCFVEHQPDPETFKKYVQFEFEINSKNNCYVKCLLEKLDMFDPNEGFLKHNIMTQLTARNPKVLEPLMKGFDRCATLNPRLDNDTCGWAARSFDCFMKKNRAVILQSFANDKPHKNL